VHCVDGANLPRHSAKWWRSPLAARAQPRSTIVLGNSKDRIRQITTVAVARKSLLAPWRYLETGLAPEGSYGLLGRHRHPELPRL
jgi:hypothetical protein